MNGVYDALCLPCRMRAALVAMRPSTWPSASIRYQRTFLATSLTLAMNVDIPENLSPIENRCVGSAAQSELSLIPVQPGLVRQRQTLMIRTFLGTVKLRRPTADTRQWNAKPCRQPTSPVSFVTG